MQDKNPFGLLSEPTTPTPSRQRKRRREASTSTSTQLVVSPASGVPIKIYYRVRLPETEGFKYVPRHTAQKDLLEAQEIKSLENSFGGTATVSPSRSACSETEVRVDVNFPDLLAWMKREVMDEVNSRMDRADAKLNDHIADSSFVLQCGKYASLRVVEDWVLTRMKRIARLPSETSHRETVEYFLRNYIAQGVPKEYLLSLMHSTARNIALDYVHMPPDDADAVRSMWNSLSRMLTTEEREKYQALMQFGRGFTSVKYRG